ncbi:PREDICTED: probable dual specificity protein phosphatase DDB_G0283417 [Papilio polytes]|uniref:probable dual specificity protein phosphatase DDB_G0283417 n=1 Tax=Papilio polytes TaxID=76194 RepID=UPI000676460C|nr:PREDICTED: probable dual specificity protein phosphatase DDB_G0283417 [Papilio polytes]
MNFLEELIKKKQYLKETETIVTKVDGKRFIEGKKENIALPSNYGFVVDTKPDDVPILIVDYVYIGSQDCVADSVLESYNISNVLSLGIERNIKVKNKYVECLDLPETNIVPVVKVCLPYISDSVANKANVLIHCNAGVSRTSMVVIAYLMSLGMEYDNAYSLVKSKRPAIQPNVGFVKQLKTTNFSQMSTL